jgi:8-oxo-dGTP diphosphatase
VKPRKTIPEKLWKTIVATMAIACVDLIVHRTVNHGTRVLLGYRKIYPYRDCWALPGGRMIKNETLREAANRQLEEIGLRPTDNYRLVGVYPVNFKRRSDISICLSTRLPSRQEPRTTSELVRYVWRPLNGLPSRLGSNYRTMLRDFKDQRYRVR